MRLAFSKFLPLGGVLCVAALLAAPLGCQRDEGKAAAEIVIGHLAAMTGDTATFGTSADEGLRLALEEINAKGGVLGKPVRVITEDDRSLQDEAKTVANKLITRDKVVAIIGEIASSRTIAAAPVAQEARIPLLSPGSTNVKVTEAGDYIFRACFIDDFQGSALANFAINDLRLKRIAVLYPANSPYGVGLRESFTAAVKKAGAEIVADVSYTENADVDFRGQLTKIRTAGAEAIFCSGYYTEAGLIAKQAKELGINAPLLGCDGWDSPETVKLGGEAINGSYFTNHYAAEEDRPEVKAFVEAYRKKYKVDGKPKTPDAMAILGYDAMRLMADAITRAGSTDGAKIRDALAATKDFPGASGTITIDEKRNAKKAIVILKIDNGQFKYVTRVKP